MALISNPVSVAQSIPAAAPPPDGKRIRLANRSLARLWALGLADKPRLEPDLIVAKAVAAAGGHATMPAADWYDRLALLTDCLETTASLTPLGRTIAYGQLIAAATNMVRMQALWHRRPEILEQPVTAPIVIVGQMRSGSTRVQRLLACDPRFQHTRFFESWCPLPRFVAGPVLDDRRWRASSALTLARGLNPAFDAIHPTAASQPDEEIGLFNILMASTAYEVQWRVPEFTTHCEAMETAPLYRDFKRMLQTIAWFRGRPDPRPWILKVPQFSQDLVSLLEAFPGARVVRISRTVRDVVASSASLVHNQMSVQSSEIDPYWIGCEWQRKVDLREARTVSGLSAYDGPRTELRYDAMSEDWRGEIARVYEMIGEVLTPEVERSMARYIQRSRGCIDAHHYEPAQFGLVSAAEGRHCTENAPSPTVIAAPSIRSVALPAEV